MMDDIEGPSEVDQGQKTDVAAINASRRWSVTLTSAVAVLWPLRNPC